MTEEKVIGKKYILFEECPACGGEGYYSLVNYKGYEGVECGECKGRGTISRILDKPCKGALELAVTNSAA